MVRAITLIYRLLHRDTGLVTPLDEEWNFVQRTYLNGSLFYHNIDHIEEVCAWLMENADVDHEEEYLGLLWGGLFHDWVDPRKKLAEVRSAAALVDFLDEAMVEGKPWSRTSKIKIIEVAADAIIATQSHVTDDPVSQWLVDADLLRFTCEDNRYAHQIRQEYPDTPDDVFNFHRERILKQYLARDPFFYHVPELDDLAKANIQRQLAEL
jgi:predicted metal-dependent HD superfamily phosphohydrolase